MIFTSGSLRVIALSHLLMFDVSTSPNTWRYYSKQCFIPRFYQAKYKWFNWQIAENIKEFFHDEGIHSTTIQPEFVDYHPAVSDGNEGDCMINCPKGPGMVPAPACEASQCCPVSNGKRGSRSMQNTPTTSRRPINESEVAMSDNEDSVPLHDYENQSSTSWWQAKMRSFQAADNLYSSFTKISVVI